MFDWKVWLTPALLTVFLGAWAILQGHRKLQLDLFEKRFRCYKELADTTYARVNDISSQAEDELSPAKVEIMLRLEAAGLETKFLFGPKVHELYKLMSYELNGYAATCGVLRAIERGRTDPEQLEETLGLSSKQMRTVILLRARLLERMEPHMRLYTYRPW